jgi:hypothetical protein
MHSYANTQLLDDNINVTAINKSATEGRAFLDAVKDASVEALGYFLNPSELFSAVAKRGEGGVSFWVIWRRACRASNALPWGQGPRTILTTCSTPQFDIPPNWTGRRMARTPLS